MNNQMNRYAPRGRADLAKAKANSQTVTYQAGGATVELSMSTVREYLVTGNKDAVTDKEIVMFINLCKFSGLNPWLREAYCIKYGSSPATMVAGKGAFEKRAESNPNYDGREAGIITYDSETGLTNYRNGSFRLPGEEIIGGWAEVYRKDRSHSTRVEVGFDEYCGRKSDGSVNGQWASKPATMIRKVALVQALREAFPGTYNGLYDAAEMNVDETVLDMEPVEKEQPKQEAPIPTEKPVETVEEPKQEELNLNDLP